MSDADHPHAIQESQYRFPYHYLPRLEEGRFRFHEVLSWGHEYLAYLAEVSDRIAALECTSILDVGCGDGRLPSMLRARFPERRIVGIDMSERAIALARAMVPGGEFVAGDITQRGLFTQPFDCATCIDTLEHIEPAFIPAFVAGIRSHCKPGGTLLVTVPSTNVKLTRKHYQHFTPELLADSLSSSFQVNRIDYLNGTSALLRILRTMLTNRYYTIVHPAPLTAFYAYYRRNHLCSDRRRGGRLIAQCTPR